jgi:hypothetical protein
MTSTAENLKAAIAMLRNDDESFSLLDDLAEAAERRLDKAAEFPDERRHMEAAEELVALAEGIRALGLGHPLYQWQKSLIDMLDEEDGYYEARLEFIGEIGFRVHYRSAEDFLKALTKRFAHSFGVLPA